MFSIATGWICPNKKETEPKFLPVRADKRVLFYEVFVWKWENLDWVKETRCSEPPRSFFSLSPNAHLCAQAGAQNESRRLIKNVRWVFRQFVYVHGDFKGMLPCWCTLAEHSIITNTTTNLNIWILWIVCLKIWDGSLCSASLLHCTPNIFASEYLQFILRHRLKFM